MGELGRRNRCKRSSLTTRISFQYPDVEEWRNNALANYLPADFDESRWIVPFTHDWGVCNTFLFDVFTMRAKMSSAIDIARTGTAWSVMGDLNSNCETHYIKA